MAPLEGLATTPKAAKQADCLAEEVVAAILKRRQSFFGRRSDTRGYLSVLVNVEETRSAVRCLDHGAPTFAKGASLEDPSRLFNASLDGNTRRATDIREGVGIDEGALKRRLRADVTINMSSGAKRPKRMSTRAGA
ncbi:hypothetical protein [Microvirga makkahensis]|uniref:hypothetical protein n=1 Tax=Microvirga makkahensis TaxID=1128670 RepID=UPI001FE9AA0E|nr:hypothetical protein [Microvirga makkahensis]